MMLIGVDYHPSFQRELTGTNETNGKFSSGLWVL